MTLNDKDPGRNAFKDIKVLVVGGDYLSPQLKEETEKYLHEHGSDAVIKIGYGLSEATGFSCTTAAMDEKYVKDATLGIPNPDTILKTVEPNTDIEKGPNDIGEICISGPTVMMGYINEEEETNKTLIVHNDGKIWLHTGDQGMMDKDGFIYFKQRIKRMIVSSGYCIYPQYIENIIDAHKDVLMSCVIGIPHPYKVQVAKAFIVLNEGYKPNSETLNSIKEHCAKNIAKYSLPYEYEFRTSIPKTKIGKIAFNELIKEEKEKKKKK
jgi:long-chain acyl-CoA synthetase